MMKSLKNSRLAFLDYLQEIKGYSELTVKSYDEAISQMLQLCSLERSGDVWLLDLMPFRLHIASQKPKTIAKKLSGVRSFVAYLVENGTKIKLRNDESVKVPKSLPKPIAHEHIVAALRGAPLLERCVVTMIYALGLRISELANLRLEDIGSEWVKVLGKGSKERYVPLLGDVATLIEQYKAQYAPKRFLFERDGVKLSENSLRYSVTKLFKKAGLKVTPHQLRHSYATQLLANGARIVDVSELLGHKSLETTQIYTKLSSSLKMDNYLLAHPICKDSLGAD